MMKKKASKNAKNIANIFLFSKEDCKINSKNVLSMMFCEKKNHKKTGKRKVGTHCKNA